MAKLAPNTIPTEPIGSIPRPVDSREQFIDDLLSEHETEIRRRLKKGAHKGSGGLRRRTAGHEDRSLWEPPQQLSLTLKQARALAVLAGRAQVHRGAYLP